MTSLIVSTSLDITFGVLWWLTKTTSRGIYYSLSYIVYGKEETELVNKSDMTKLIEEINDLKLQIIDLNNDKLSILNNKIDDEEYTIIENKMSINPPDYNTIF